MKKLIILFFVLIDTINISAQVPQIVWQHSLGGSNNDEAYSIIQTSDGGYIVSGYTNSNDSDVTGNHGYTDYWVVKLNSSGTIDWQKTLGGTNSDYAMSIIQTYDGGYAVAGYSESNNGDVTGNHGYFDYWVVKMNAAGTIEWQKSLGGTSNDHALAIVQSSDSGYFVAGYTESNDGDVTGNHGWADYWVVKLNASGTMEWQHALGGTGSDYAFSIIKTVDSGCLVTGWTDSNDGDVTGFQGVYDYWVVKLDPYGTIQWKRTLGGSSYDQSRSVIPTSDGGYMIAGYSSSNDGDVSGNHGNHDYWLVKLNVSGVMEWQKSLGGTFDDDAFSIIQTSDSGFVVAGASESNDGDVTGHHDNKDYWVVKIDVSGNNIVWQKSLGGSGFDYGYSIVEATDNGFVVAGGSPSTNGDVTGNLGVSDYWIVKLGVATGIENLSNSNKIDIFPNPSTGNFSINGNSEYENSQLNVFNAMGCNVYSCRLTQETKVIDAEDFPSGVYYLQIIKGEKIWAEKIIKQ